MRLTHYDEHKKRWQVNIDYGAVMIDALNYAVGEAVDKLAAYEDTGYSPLEIKSLESELNAARTKVGDTVTVTDLVRELNKQKWIPVTERLPEKGKYVLVRYKNNDMTVACWFDGDEDILFWRAMTDEGWCADCDTDPTHWMPLPAPPKEER